MSAGVHLARAYPSFLSMNKGVKMYFFLPPDGMQGFPAPIIKFKGTYLFIRLIEERYYESKVSCPAWAQTWNALCGVTLVCLPLGHWATNKNPM